MRWIVPMLVTAALVSAASASTPTHRLTRNHESPDFSYTIVRVPDSFGASGTAVERANRAGDILGRYLVGTGKSWHGFVRQNGAFHSLDVPGATRTLPQGMNDKGDIVGRHFVGTVEHAFRYSKGKYESYDVDGSSGTRFYDINDSGTVTGSYRVGTGNWQPMLWKDGAFVPLTAVATDLGADMAEGFGIDAAGRVVGHYTRKGDPRMYGFIYREGTTTLSLAHPQGTTGSGAMSCAAGIVDGGEIVGHFTDAAAGGVTGYIWSGGQFVGTLRLPGATSTYPQGVTSAGLIAGSAILATGEKVGFTATPK